ncbi:hypothetical protein V5735_11145 (plasmid) [Haladaptatus sp. SPP-AMP-3]|uniref:hypothetical protein n=1 Tax=Haladaptatus sp. SPP-AMP-3 TaxID=3121295 RepID=UPI003C30573A
MFGPLGPLTVGKKAAKVGYRRFGKAGAVAFGIGAVGGYVVLRKKVKSMMAGDTDDSSSDDGAETSDEAA